MNRGAKGARLERKSKAMLEALGYYVIRAAGSHGPWDLVAMNQNGARLIQVKANAWPGSIEMEALEAFPRFGYATKEVWRWRDRTLEPDIKVL